MNYFFGSRITAAAFLAVSLSFSLFLSPTLAISQEPDEVLKEIVAKIKQSSNASPVIDYVDWDKAYGNTPEHRRQFMGVDSPDAMKAYYRRVLNNPVQIMREQFKKKLETVPNAQKPALEQTFARMEKVMGEKTDEMHQRMKTAEYTIGEAVVTGDVAIVPMKQEFQGNVRDEKVRFEKSGDRWLLPAVGMMNTAGSS